MSSFIETDIRDYHDNIIKAFADDWALITACDENNAMNTMVGGWGGVGYMWGKPVFTCVIRPQRYTFRFAQACERMTLSFFDGGYRDALKLLGTVSGRDCDKIAQSGLTPVRDGDIAYFEEASTVMVGRKLYVAQMTKEAFLDESLRHAKYPEEDYHYTYVCEIEKLLKKKAD